MRPLRFILLTLPITHPSLSEPVQQQVLAQPSDHHQLSESRPNPLDDLSGSDIQSDFIPSIQPLRSATNLGNLTQPLVGPQPKSALHPSTQQLQSESIHAPRNNSTHSYPNTSSPPSHLKRSFIGHPRDLNAPAQTWPGTDTVFATKTVFISQASPATTVYVSNGQILTSYSPAPSSPPDRPHSSDQNPGVWVVPSGNPNIVVATVTAMSSAQKFAWDEYYGSNKASWWTMIVLINFLIPFFTFLGFGFVSFGL